VTHRVTFGLYSLFSKYFRWIGLGLGLSLLLAALLLSFGRPQGGWWAQWFGASDKKIQASQVTAGELRAAKPMPKPVAMTPSSPMAEASNTSVQNLLANANLPAGHPEKRLIEIYAQVEHGDFAAALKHAQALVKDHPNFQLAHLIHGDLLRLRYQPTAGTDAVASNPSANGQMAALRAESRMRLDALRNRPAPGWVPKQLLAVSGQSRHVIAIDASRGRLYWFENQTGLNSNNPINLKLVSDFFISVGKSGIRKQQEGDGRTPLGIYYVTSIRDRKGLPEFYGAGALPINYPNALDIHKGRTGSGIWLHGTPPNQFVRAPLASDGCVVLANPDMQRLLEQVSAGSTPVVIAEKLEWVPASDNFMTLKSLQTILEKWQADRSVLSNTELYAKYAARSSGLQKVKESQPEWAVSETAQLGVTQLSLLQTQDPEPALVATFEETLHGKATGVVHRQYWTQQDSNWRLILDAVIGGTPPAGLKRQVASPSLQAETANPPAKRELYKAESKIGSTKPSGQNSDGSVQKALQTWTKAWSHKNMPAYFKAYDTTFTPPGGISRKAWEQDRADRILGKNNIALSMNNMKIQMDGDRATVTFIQHYKADKLDVTARKTLRLIRRGEEWRITQENVS